MSPPRFGCLYKVATPLIALLQARLEYDALLQEAQVSLSGKKSAQAVAFFEASSCGYDPKHARLTIQGDRLFLEVVDKDTRRSKPPSKSRKDTPSDNWPGLETNTQGRAIFCVPLASTPKPEPIFEITKPDPVVQVVQDVKPDPVVQVVQDVKPSEGAGKLAAVKPDTRPSKPAEETGREKDTGALWAKVWPENLPASPELPKPKDLTTVFVYTLGLMSGFLPGVSVMIRDLRLKILEILDIDPDQTTPWPAQGRPSLGHQINRTFSRMKGKDGTLVIPSNRGCVELTNLGAQASKEIKTWRSERAGGGGQGKPSGGGGQVVSRQDNLPELSLESVVQDHTLVVVGAMAGFQSSVGVHLHKVQPNVLATHRSSPDHFSLLSGEDLKPRVREAFGQLAHKNLLQRVEGLWSLTDEGERKAKYLATQHPFRKSLKQVEGSINITSRFLGTRPPSFFKQLCKIVAWHLPRSAAQDLVEEHIQEYWMRKIKNDTLRPYILERSLKGKELLPSKIAPWVVKEATSQFRKWDEDLACIAIRGALPASVRKARAAGEVVPYAFHPEMLPEPARVIWESSPGGSFCFKDVIGGDLREEIEEISADKAFKMGFMRVKELLRSRISNPEEAERCINILVLRMEDQMSWTAIAQRLGVKRYKVTSRRDRVMARIEAAGKRGLLDPFSPHPIPTSLSLR